MAFYWYQSDPGLYEAEVTAMRKYFPSFQINQLPDGSGRLYWRGKVQPMGEGGMVWDLMLIYKNDHPHASGGEYGGSVQILPVQPRLKDIAEKMMPLLIQTYGSYEEYFICTADPKYFKTGQSRSTSAASALSWACKWIVLCEMWLNGEISDDVALEGNY